MFMISICSVPFQQVNLLMVGRMKKLQYTMKVSMNICGTFMCCYYCILMHVILLTGYGPSDSYQQGGRLSLGKSLS